MRRHGTLGELVTFRSTRGLDLDSILYQDKANKITIVHIHGSFGNFYQNQFLRLMAKMYLDAGINLLSFNLAGHDGIAEGYRYDGDFEYVGGAIANFEECIFDIEGAVTFANQFSDCVILQGHSLGCDRILHFLTNRAANHDFILLAPCDSYQLQANWIAPESVEQQIARLKAHLLNGEFDWVPAREYGIRQKDWVYSIPVTRKALLSIMEGPVFRLIRIGTPARFSLNQKALIYIGGNDVLQTATSEVMFRYFEERVHKVTRVYMSQGDHSLLGCEYKVIQQIISWAQQ